MGFIRLIRLFNLVIIALTMFGVRLYLSQFNPEVEVVTLPFLLLVVSTVFIAAAGNIINDYFDVRADRINRPKKVVIGRSIKRRWAIVLHWIFNIIAVLIGLYLSWLFKSVQLLLILFTATVLLWWYSVSLKKKPIIGNVVVSLLSVLVLYLSLLLVELEFPIANMLDVSLIDKVFFVPIFRVVFAFMICAFMQNLAREIVKDVEDVKGDLAIRAKTLPMLIGGKKALQLVALLVLIFPVYYFVNVVFTISNFNWLKGMPITLAALMNLVIVIIVFVAKEETVVRISKVLLKLSMVLGLLYLFIVQ